MSSIKGSPGPQSFQPLHPLTDAEIEAQAIRERESSRRAAERILTQEAEERRLMEERILAMKNSSAHSSSNTNVPMPAAPSLAQPIPPFAASSPGGGPVTPSGSPRTKDKDGWWEVAKQRLTPTKEPALTPAQQVIQEAKGKEKESKKKSKDKDRGDANGKTKPPVSSSDGAHLNLNNLPTSRAPLTSPLGSKNTAFSHAPPSPGGEYTPMASTVATSAPGPKEAPPLYAKFDPTGRLDVPETLLAITRRFEKLERWTVGHVRALEDRVGDVEKWLVDKEEARVKAEEETQKFKADEVEARRREHDQLQQALRQAPAEVSKRDLDDVNAQVAHVKDGLSELKGIMRDLQHEQLSLVKASASSSSAPTAAPIKPQITGGLPTTNSRTKLPYPTGDYTASAEMFSPPSSPPPRVLSPTVSSATTTTVPHPSSYGFSPAATANVITSPSLHSSSSYSILPVPQHSSSTRPISTSPTPTLRKRYTVALGGPLTSPLEQLAQDFDAASRTMENHNHLHGDTEHSPHSYHTAVFSSDSPPHHPQNLGHLKDDTIGGTPINLSRLGSMSPQQDSPGIGASNTSNSRIRAQSSYGAPAGWNAASRLQSTTPPLRPRRKSGGSTAERPAEVLNRNTANTLGGNGKFVDPLIIRKKEKEGGYAASGLGGAGTRATGPVRGKTVGELAAFFDGGDK